jgi:taurine dioxygenase
MEIRPLSPALGAEVRGIDLREPLDPAGAGAIYRAWLEHQVLVFRDQQLDGPQQVRFTRHFGELQLAYSPIRDGTEVNYIGNGMAPDGKPGARGDGIFPFHQDGVYRERPTKVTMLYALAVPSRGGDTLFASTYGAYDALSPELQARCAELDVVHCYYKSGATADVPKSVERYTHPLVIAHPDTGRPLLLCDREMSESIVGLSADDGTVLLDQLCTSMERPENVYAHVWRKGDLVLWDNLATAHARTDFDPAERRMMQRTTVLGMKPARYVIPSHPELVEGRGTATIL